jgi:hypothetical protein
MQFQNFGYNQQGLITQGLILYVDSLVSGSATSTTWTDQTGRNNNVTFTNSPTLTSVNGVQVVNFVKASSQYGTTAITGEIDRRTLDYTIIGLARYTDTVSNGRVLGGGNNFIWSHWNNSTENYFAAGVQVTTLGTGTNDTNWRYYHATGLNPGGVGPVYEYYINNTFKASSTAAGGNGPQGFKLCVHIPGGASAEHSNGQIAFMMMYNRVLTANERIQTYNYFKNRFWPICP